ncbi:MAG: phosphatidylserine decarboxylase family protein [Saprospiraceae bacterium]|nr:phosphatidylserine decarboxylase family protein [Saprospiraceae bacterium]MCB9323963.1 phosphatidylserine decarboxylase family protein [Lewinellaceae bacterium]
MKIHKEGHWIVITLTIFLLLVNFLVSRFFPGLTIYLAIVSVGIWFFVLWFFRNPTREIFLPQDNVIYAPADGKIVVIEEIIEPEYFHEKRIQVSIFMSPANVHVNRNPISGTVNYFKYHPGKYLVAWHPKSSTENERATTVIKNGHVEIMLRQIAGAMAKRIKTYLHVGEEVVQGTDLGFIKFGSRVDLFLPLDAKLEVEIGQKVKGNKTIIARY